MQLYIWKRNRKKSNPQIVLEFQFFFQTSLNIYMSPGIIFVENNVFKWYHVYGSKILYLKKKRNEPLIFFLLHLGLPLLN